MSIDLINAKAVKKALESIEPAIAKTVLAKAGRRGVAPTTTAARRNVRKVSRTIAKSIGVRQKRYKHALSTVLGPRSGFSVIGEDGRKHNPVNTSHLVEQGTEPHIIRRAAFGHENGEYVGEVQHPGTKGVWFMKRAWASKGGNAMFTRYASEIERMIPIEIERVAAKARAK